MIIYAVMVSLVPPSYTVTEGEDGFAELTLVRSGDTSGETSVTVTPGPRTATGKLTFLAFLSKAKRITPYVTLHHCFHC